MCDFWCRCIIIIIFFLFLLSRSLIPYLRSLLIPRYLEVVSMYFVRVFVFHVYFDLLLCYGL